MNKCWYCGKGIEYVEGFGWREVGTKQGFTCWHEHAGRMTDADSGHAPDEIGPQGREGGSR